MSKQNKYKAIIIGAGHIAAGYDSPDDLKILTHAHAYKKHSQTELLGFYDVDAKKADQAAQKWSCQSFSDLEEVASQQPDIISVCVPDNVHFATLKRIAAFRNKPKLVICEKPLTAAMEDSLEIIRIYAKENLPLLVDHTQRFNQTAQAVAAKLQAGEYGKIVSASAIYSNGVLHAGTHVLDLARYFFGEAKSFQALYNIKDRKSDDDRTVGAFIEFEDCPQFYLIAGDIRSYSFADFNIICEKGRISFPDFWFTLAEQKAIASPIFKGERVLGKPVVKKTKYFTALLNLIDSAINHLEKGKPLLSAGADAVKTQELCSLLLKEIK